MSLVRLVVASVLASAAAIHASPLPGGSSARSEYYQSGEPASKLTRRSDHAGNENPLAMLEQFGRAEDRPGRPSTACWIYSSLSPVWKHAPARLRTALDGAFSACVDESGHPLPSAPFPDSPNKNFAPLYNQYRDELVLRFTVLDVNQARALQEATTVLLLDIWEVADDWVDIRLSEDLVNPLLGLLPSSMQNSYTVLIQDLSQAVADTYPLKVSGKTAPFFDHRVTADRTDSSTRSSVVHPPVALLRDGEPGRPRMYPKESNIFFSEYQPLSVIHPWMRLLESMFPTHTRLIKIGQTFEGRDILALKVGVRSRNEGQSNGPRPTIVVSAGTHAREWIGPSSLNYLAYTFITSYGKTQPITEQVQAFDWVFIPTLNPDGYVYTWENDRLWRKNRQPTSLRFCNGIDIDRSFSYEWDKGAHEQSSPCSESWPGEQPFEAAEARALRDWTRSETDSGNATIVAFLDLHSYSQQVLYPFSFSCSHDPPSLENLQELGLGLAKAIRLTPGGDGQLYDVLSACEGNVNFGSQALNRLIPGGGSALDWFYAERRARYSYQIKLRDTGAYGFLLPKEEIVPTGREVVEAATHLGRYLLGSIGLGADATREKDKTSSRDFETQQTHAQAVLGS